MFGDMEEDIESETLNNPRRYNPETETDRKHFATCIMHLKTLLTVLYYRIIEASVDVTLD